MGWCSAQCKMLLFCVKTVMKSHFNFELACLMKKKKKKKEMVHLRFIKAIKKLSF